VHLSQVGKTTLRECTNEIESGCRGVVALDQPARVGLARLGREVVSVDDVAPVGGQGHVSAGLGVARPRLGELARHAAHLDDRLGGAVGEHDGHLQDRLDPVADLLCRGTGERLGAVAALQQERVALGGPREAFAQNIHLTGEHERWQGRDLGGGGADGIRVRPVRLLLDRERPPIVETGDHFGISDNDGFGRVDHAGIP
jgi:hypothetical protein